MAYVVGAKLTRIQVVALNINYAIWGFYLAATGDAAMMNGFNRRELAQEMLVAPAATVPYSIQVYWSLGTMLMVTSLWFMWSMRHPKTE